MLKIIANGSKWLGQEPDTVETLLEVLNTYTLDPTFEDYGNFYQANPQWLHKEAAEKYKGCAKFFGNFLTYSHSFDIITDEPELIEQLVKAINNNKLRLEYQKTRQEIIARRQKREELAKLFNAGKLDFRTYYQLHAEA